jgi:putrescine transport system ATP-binding protein
MALLELIDLCKTYETPAVSDIRLSLESGQILCLLGPSGCGKTTLLRLVAGLEPPDRGQVFLNSLDITHLQPHKRQIGMMFQEFALFPHKSVFENVAFGLQMQKQTHSQIVIRTEEMLSLVGMSELSKRNVADLSGGERQRVALARSLAPRPKLLMLDEP